ncbi:MAG TPA: methyltransferase domain-containing protein [Alphaproteobacteria bacterium]
MDLRPYRLSAADVERAKALLEYQPFIVADTVCTGVAYDWLYSPDPEAHPRREVYDLSADGPEMFQRALDANTRLLRTYEAFARAMCAAFPGETYLDVSCNSGLLPIFMSLNGMGDCFGLDLPRHANAFSFLTGLTGSPARFMPGAYVNEPQPAIATGNPDDSGREFDVVSSMAFLCHVGDPLHVLQVLAGIAKKAVFVWSGFIESDENLIRLGEPRPASQPGLTGVWSRYSYGTALSTRLLFSTMNLLGFPFRLEVAYPPDGLAPDWHQANMKQYGAFRAFLFVRESYMDDVSRRLKPAGG